MTESFYVDSVIMDTRTKAALEGISIVSTMKKDIYVAHVTRHILGMWIILSILQSFTSL